MNDMKKGKIIFNKNVKVIGESAFEGLSTLTSITIPKSIKTIENNAFKDCENLEEMKYNGTVEGWTQIVINSGWKGSENIDFVICSNGNYDYYLVYKVIDKDISGLEYNSVDLGLVDDNGNPLLFSDRLVGATSPEDIGALFQWGDTKGYKIEAVKCSADEVVNLFKLIADGYELELNRDNLREVIDYLVEDYWGYDYEMEGNDLTTTTFGFSDYSFDWNNYKYCNGSYNTITKYCTQSSYGTVDNKTVLELEDDAAYINMGSDWRMPTIDELRQLTDETKIKPYFVRMDGVEFTKEEAEIYDEETNSYPIPFNKFKGIRFESLINGNSIFIPACGGCNGSLLSRISDYGYLWSSSLYEGNSYYGRGLSFGHDGILDAGYDWYRYVGLCVLGVKNLYLNNQ